MMTHDEQVIEQLDAFSFVAWDRFVDQGSVLTVYGWIARDDERSDFVVLVFEDGRVRDGVTSSAARSPEIAALLGMMGEHVDCERVEDRFGAVANPVRLAGGAT